MVRRNISATPGRVKQGERCLAQNGQPALPQDLLPRGVKVPQTAHFTMSST